MDLDSLRREIDRCDSQIVRLINERASYAREIGRIKREKGGPIYAPEREAAVYEKVAKLNEGPLPERAIRAIYREIMSGAIALEAPTRISYLGPPGTFSHLAAMEKFGSSVEHLPAREIRDVFLAVARGHADYGIVPVENSTEGSVNQTMDAFMESDLRICSEAFLPIHLNLLARCEIGQVKVVATHPQPLAQCRNWLAANMAHARIVETASTTAAADMAVKEEGVAAVASEAAAAIYGLNVLNHAVEDNPNNTTRFVILGHECGKRTGKDRTSIVFSLRHESGSLYESLIPFKSNSINLTRIESRPNRRRVWEYCFFIDLEGHQDDPAVAKALAEVKANTHDFKVLGSYPRAEQARPVSRPMEA